MKKIVIAFATACMVLTAGSSVYASAPVTEKKHHEHQMHMKKVEKKEHHAKKKMHAKSHKEKLHKLHAKGLKTKATMPKTGLGGASEQTE